jgi:hypothetical protein
MKPLVFSRDGWSLNPSDPTLWMAGPPADSMYTWLLSQHPKAKAKAKAKANGNGNPNREAWLPRRLKEK